MYLTVLIPAYNEEDRIRGTLEVYARAVADLDAEIVVVVNGSNDKTEALIREEYLSRIPRLRLVVIPEKVGKGGAIMRGLSEARGEKIAFTDADGSTPPSSLLSLVESLKTSGICIGSRWMSESKIGRAQPLSRQVASRLFNGLVHMMFGVHVSDTQCGAKVMTRDAMAAVLPKLGCTQWAFDVELLFQIQKAGFPILEKPIEWNDVSGSKVRVFRCSLEMIGALLRLRVLYSPLRCMVKAWDKTFGSRLFHRRLERMEAVYRRRPDE